MTFTLHLTTIVDNLLRTVAALVGGGVHPRRIDPPVTLLLHRRLSHLLRRVVAIVARVASGTLRAPQGRPRPRDPAAPRAPAPTWPNRLRGSHLWLVRLAQITAAYGTQLQALLATPDSRALIAAAPQLRIILRPLCRMLGVAIPAPPPHPGPGPTSPAPTPPSPRPPNPRQAAVRPPARHRPDAPRDRKKSPEAATPPHAQIITTP